MPGGVAKESNGISLNIATLSNTVQTEAFILTLLSTLRKSASEIAPDTFQYLFFDQKHEPKEGPRTPLREDTIATLVRALGSQQLGRIKLTRSVPPGMTVDLPTRCQTGIRHRLIHLLIEKDLVRPDAARARFLRLAQHLFLTCDGFFGDFGIFSLPESEAVDGAPDVKQIMPTNLAKGLPPPDWGLLLGRQYVALIGADRLRQAPCPVVQEFAEDRFMLLLAADFEVLDSDSSYLKKERRRLVAHLGPEYFSYVKGAGPKKVIPELA